MPGDRSDAPHGKSSLLGGKKKTGFNLLGGGRFSLENDVRGAVVEAVVEMDADRVESSDCTDDA